MGNEPDDSQTMVHLLMYTEEYLLSRIARDNAVMAWTPLVTAKLPPAQG